MVERAEQNDWKRTFSDDPVTVRKRVLQECEQALDETRGLVQRLRSHEEGCCALDARDKRAIGWGLKALESIRAVLND